MNAGVLLVICGAAAFVIAGLIALVALAVFLSRRAKAPASSPGAAAVPAPAAGTPASYDGHNLLHHYAAYSIARQQKITLDRMQQLLEGGPLDPKAG